jgi:hypothetical protein
MTMHHGNPQLCRTMLEAVMLAGLHCFLEAEADCFQAMKWRKPKNIHANWFLWLSNGGNTQFQKDIEDALKDDCDDEPPFSTA